MRRWGWKEIEESVVRSGLRAADGIVVGSLVYQATSSRNLSGSVTCLGFAKETQMAGSDIARFVVGRDLFG